MKPDSFLFEERTVVNRKLYYPESPLAIAFTAVAGCVAMTSKHLDLLVASGVSVYIKSGSVTKLYKLEE